MARPSRRLTRRCLMSRAAALPVAWPVACLLGGATTTLGSDPSAWAAEPDAAETLIRDYQAVLLDVMRRADALGPRGRAEVLAPAVRATYDLDRMARAAAGKAWREATPDARAVMVEAFAGYSVAVHADRFAGHGGETFVIDGTAPGPGGTVLVNTRIARPTADDVPLTYVVGETPNGPRVIDVLMEGTISEVALRRSEWATLGQREGLSGLAAALTRKAEALLSKS